LDSSKASKIFRIIIKIKEHPSTPNATGERDGIQLKQGRALKTFARNNKNKKFLLTRVQYN
jgi:hypothetical protein